MPNLQIKKRLIMDQKQIPVITIDGPSGVGKGTLALVLAKKFNWHLLDSGSIYRVLAFAVQQQMQSNQLNLENEQAIIEMAQNLPIQFKSTATGLQIQLNQQDITQQIRTEQIGMLASKIAVYPNVRQALLQKQRDFAQFPGLIADGRDMGTIVFPEAPVKLFLDASVEARTKRRFYQLQKLNVHASIDEIYNDIVTRDERDRNRSIAPLKPAEDAYLIDTTALTIDQVIELACNYIELTLSTKS